MIKDRPHPFHPSSCNDLLVQKPASPGTTHKQASLIIKYNILLFILFTYYTVLK